MLKIDLPGYRNERMWALYWILKRLDPYQSGMFDNIDPRGVIDRWRSLEPARISSQNTGRLTCSNHDIKQEFLVLIAILYYHYSIDKKTGFIGSADSPDIVPLWMLMRPLLPCKANSGRNAEVLG